MKISIKMSIVALFSVCTALPAVIGAVQLNSLAEINQNINKQRRDTIFQNNAYDKNAFFFELRQLVTFVKDYVKASGNQAKIDLDYNVCIILIYLCFFAEVSISYKFVVANSDCFVNTIAYLINLFLVIIMYQLKKDAEELELQSKNIIYPTLSLSFGKKIVPYDQLPFAPDKCPICWCDYQENDTLTIFNCGHLLHTGCDKQGILNCFNCMQEIKDAKKIILAGPVPSFE